VLAEVGRQPWAVEGVLPTFLGASSLSVPQLLTSITAFTLLYGSLAVVEVGLIIKTVKKGPFAQHEPVLDESPETEPAVA
jgi:cytochrome d ubiquinol oxidase subunit I